MKNRYKKAFSSFEVIISIVISSIVVVYSMLYIKNSYTFNKNSKQIEIYKLDLLSTKAFLQKHENIKNKLLYKNQSLYFENSVLLENIKEFNIKEHLNYLEISINLDDKIKQIWKIKK